MSINIIKRLLLPSGNKNAFRLIVNRSCSSSSSSTSTSSSVDQLSASKEPEWCSDEPVEGMENPFKKPVNQCILCRYKIELNYKNPRLLSQFVSAFSGLVYDRHITGLCQGQQLKLLDMVKKSQYNGLMPYIYREPRYKNDPKLFDPMRPSRPNPH